MRTSFLMNVIFFCGLVTSLYADSLVIAKPETGQPVHMALVYEDDLLRETAQQIKKLLLSTGLFNVTVSIGSIPVSKKEIVRYMQKGSTVVLFMQRSGEDQYHSAWRLYDATDGTMLVGKSTGSKTMQITARLVADAVYRALFNHASFFLTKIAYIKKSPTVRNKRRTELCILDPVDGSQQTLVKDDRILVAPQWSRTTQQGVYDNPWLTVSEFTPRNVRLLGIDLTGHSWSILDLSGTCVGTAPCDDTTCVYVRSGVLWLYEFDQQTKKSRHTKLTDSRDTVGCPSLLSCGDIIYASNNKIYRYARQEKKSYPISIPGSCMAPDVHTLSDRIIFSRSVKGVLQLHSCDAQGKNITQVTHGPGNKIDACWSPCGNYVVYTRIEDNREQIARYNLMTNTEKILTPEDQLCGYASWSEPSLQLHGDAL